MTIEIVNGTQITENGWTITPYLNKFTGARVGELATRPLDPDIQAEIDAVCTKVRERKDQEPLNRLKLAILHH